MLEGFSEITRRGKFDPTSSKRDLVPAYLRPSLRLCPPVTIGELFQLSPPQALSAHPASKSLRQHRTKCTTPLRNNCARFHCIDYAKALRQ